MNRFYFHICLSLLSLSLIATPIRAQDEDAGLPADAADLVTDIPVTEAVPDEVITEDALSVDEEEAAVETGVDAAVIEPAQVQTETTVPEAGTILPEAGPAVVPESAPESLTTVTADVGPVSKDVILVLDNSGSMKKNDPQFLSKQAVQEFINQLDDATRAGIIIFDQAVKLAVPLTPIGPETRSTVLSSLEGINYKGQYTDSPAAIERAIYELKTNGRADAKKLIVFMTDGIVDTGNADRDLEKAKWLRQDLAADAADAEIQIFGIAFTEEADFQLIQSLAQQTQGEYYRALVPEDLQNVYTQVHTIINKLPEPEVVTPPPVPVEPVQPAPVVPPAPVIIEVPVQPQGMDQEEKARSIMILVALTVLILAVIIMVLMLWRGSRRKPVTEEYAQEAFLQDINNYTGQSSFKLGNKPTMLGRVAGTDTDHLNYIVIPQTTIGRRHALIEYKDFAYWIIDQGSINGTFVNDQMITSETRLKHGDRIRLHKFEFEFIMPEMVDAGATQISKTVLAANPAMAGADVTVARGGGSHDDLPEPVFDLTAGMNEPESDPDEEETLVRGTSGAKKDTDESRDETLMMDDDNDVLNDADEDATIRPDMDDHDEDSDLTVDNFLDSDKKR